MTINKQNNDRIFRRLFNNIIIGLFLGSFIGCVIAAITGCVFWIFAQHPSPALYATVNLAALISGQIIVNGIPVGLIIGITTGLHHAIIRSNPKSLVWGVITGLATIAGIWFSGYLTDTNTLVVIFEDVFIGLMAGWLSSWLTSNNPPSQDFKNDSRLSKKQLIVSSISGFLFVFISVYGYFYIALYFANIRS